MARTGKPENPRGRPWLLLAPLPLTLGAAVGAAYLQVSPPFLLALWLVLGSVSAGIVARAWRAMTDEAEETPMPTFTVLSRIDAYAGEEQAKDDNDQCGRFVGGPASHDGPGPDESAVILLAPD